ncbi:Putative NmrA-like family protein [Aspergillus calidoustus]|uniref:Putative NmrA-like family protein n=1 Tax=Aspergillus calidoustus TaxID=454130 RepID=A0A0U5GAF6_ASPCI|nr:Putative NmrA-like family protein [Aspergillus calidoustus]
MQDHLLTEKLLKESGLTYTSIREGVYAECFTIFLDWYPERTSTLTLPADGEVAYTSRAELGEATVRMMIQGGYENQKVLFTAQDTITARQIVDIINETTGRQINLDPVSRNEYLDAWRRDPRGKPRELFEMVATFWDEIVGGGLRTTHPLLREILGREPTRPADFIRRLLEEDQDCVFRY